MKAPSLHRTFAAVGLLTVAAVAAWATEGVSPGAVDRVAIVNDPCPTFSWLEAEGCRHYELVGHVLPDGPEQPEELTIESEVLYAAIPFGATSWTPSAEQCLAPGGRYVWFVRAVHEVIDGEVVDAGEWSAGRYLAIPAAPSVDEVARALEVLERYLEAGGELGRSAPLAASGRALSPVAKGGGGLESVLTAPAAIRGEHPDVSGEVYGVVGVTGSYDGAGVAAGNLEGGPDLVLDGSTSGTVDTWISESVLTRSSPDDQPFLFHNGGGGTLDVYIHGLLISDGVTVQYGPVIDDDGHWLGVGDTIPCPGCVASSDIADGAVASADLADEAVTQDKIEAGAVSSAKLQSGSVTSAKILDGTITAADLADGSVGSAEIADGGVWTSDLAGGAVTMIKIADAAVGSAQLAAGAVASSKILDGTVAAVDLADGAVTGAKIAVGAVSSDALRSNAVTSAKILDGAVAAADLANGAVTAQKILDGAVIAQKIADGAVEGSKLRDGAVTSATIADGSIASVDIGSSQVNSTHILNMSVNTADLSPGAVTSSKIEDATITAADVDPTGGVYASKSAVYVQVLENVLDIGECISLHPQCSDVNDLPLQGVCGTPPSSGVWVQRTEASHWETETDPASWSCTICNPHDGLAMQPISAKIYCISVPGP